MNNNSIDGKTLAFALIYAIIAIPIAAYCIMSLEMGTFVSILIGSGIAIVVMIICAAIYSPFEQKKLQKEKQRIEAEEKARKDNFLSIVANGNFHFPVSEFYSQCASAGCTNITSPFYKEKAKLIADNILKVNNIPLEYYYIYDSDEKLNEYLITGEEEKKEKEAQKKRAEERIASIPHNADLTSNERNAIAIQNKVATLSGRDKREYLLGSSNQRILSRIREINAGQEAALKLGVLMSQSAAKEKTTDWSIAGGIASGIAGPAAGLAVAADTMRKNAEIEERNRQNQVAVNQLAANVMSSAFSPSSNTSSLYSQSKSLEIELEKLPSKVILTSIDELTIQKALQVVNYSVKNCTSNALEITLEISNTLSILDVPEGVRFTTDGSLKGTIYAGDMLVDTVNIPLPVFGVECGRKETVKAICGKYSKNGKAYSVSFQPNNLWVMEI